jgi:deoxyribodipyrimidine photo-lyase
MTAPVLVWLRLDLRLADNPALHEAAASGRPVVPLFVLEPPGEEPATGAASRWWLHHSLEALAERLRALGGRLVLRRGQARAVVPELAAALGAPEVAWNRRYEPAGVREDAAVAAALARAGRRATVRSGNLLAEPDAVRSAGGGSFRVFTPFHRALEGLGAPPRPLPPPRALAWPERWPAGDRLADWRLLPRAPHWAGGLCAAWTPGEAAAHARLATFLGQGVGAYAVARDLPREDGTSRLSPHLHFGELSARQLWHAMAGADPLAAGGAGAGSLLRQLAWREFCQHLLFHQAALLDRPLRPAFDRFPWRRRDAALRAWQRGETGYPIVDAGMRELWRTGWMHNRVRMIAASFLTKHLLVPWQDGAAWFLDTLVDADLANNAANWQWVAGCGADAQPYFRIFNPTLQGERFDPRGGYVRRWVPELARLPDALIHRPWQAGPLELSAAGLRLGTDYPRPIVEHAAARADALEAWRALKPRPPAGRTKTLPKRAAP